MSNLSTNLPPVPPVGSPPYQGSDAADDEIDLRELFTVLWRGKLLIVGVTLLFAIGAVVYALSLTNVYRSEALLAPAGESGGASKLGGALWTGRHGRYCPTRWRRC
ncbi:Wzz/FepE/Etk N-terminal domain-containing protein [Pseudomonadales bacterium]|nr:Wzz/FepE/Etk N-terminal domain-containing protein [Pseudomonadales bacterium]